MKIFDKADLTLANNLALKLGYNRAIEPEYLKATPDDSLWAVTFNMIHEHKAGQPTEPHIRCMLYPFEPIAGRPNTWKVNKNMAPLFVDTVTEVFERLPETGKVEAVADTDSL